jgi:hypothetical protein
MSPKFSLMTGGYPQREVGIFFFHLADQAVKANKTGLFVQLVKSRRLARVA